MKLKSIFTVILGVMAVSFAAPAVAQDWNTKVTTGAVAYSQQDYSEALKALDVALEHAAELKPKQLPKAYYYRAKTRLALMAAFMRKAAETKDTTGAGKISNYPELAFQDLKKALETDDGTWADDVQNEYNLLYGQFMMFGSQGLNQIYQNKEMSAEEKKQAFEGIVEMMQYCSEMKPDQFQPYDMSGQAKMNLADSTGALNDLKKAAEKYEANKPKAGDTYRAYIWYRMAILERNFKKDINSALKAIQKSKEVLDAEWKLMQTDKPNYKAEEWAREEKTYQDMKNDFEKYELDMLVQFPDKMDEVLKKFDENIAKNPNDYYLRVTYANLLEKIDRNKAIEQYEKAIGIDKSKEIAPYNLGALLNNMAKEKYDASNEEKDAAKSKALRDEGNAILEKAFPNFELALAANPKSLSTVKTLKMIAITLNKEAEMTKYSDMEKQLRAEGGN